MSDPQRPAVVCFDLGGVIIRICRSFEEGCRAAGLDVRPGLNDVIFGAQDDNHALNDAYQRGQIELATLAREYASAINHLYSAEEIEQVHLHWMHGEYDGVESLITEIQAQGVTTAVLSNTSHDHWIQLHTFPAFRRLENRHAIAPPRPAQAAAGDLRGRARAPRRARALHRVLR